jgi:NADH-quinone oxidoreductase subunit B
MGPHAVAQPAVRFRQHDGSELSVHLLELGLACCGLEVAAARAALDTGPSADLAAEEVPDSMPADGPGVVARQVLDGVAGVAVPGEDLTIVVVAGTVTVAAADQLQESVLAKPEPRIVVAFGACAISGGPYWDSYAVVPGFGTLLPVDLVIPGCPPRPEALWLGLRHLGLSPVPTGSAG